MGRAATETGVTYPPVGDTNAALRGVRATCSGKARYDSAATSMQGSHESDVVSRCRGLDRCAATERRWLRQVLCPFASPSLETHSRQCDCSGGCAECTEVVTARPPHPRVRGPLRLFSSPRTGRSQDRIRVSAVESPAADCPFAHRALDSLTAPCKWAPSEVSAPQRQASASANLCPWRSRILNFPNALQLLDLAQCSPGSLHHLYSFLHMPAKAHCWHVRNARGSQTASSASDCT